MPFCECLLFPGSKLEIAQRCLLVALPFLHREQVLGKSLRVHTLRRGVRPPVRPSPSDGKASPTKLLLAIGGADRLPFHWLAQCWKRGELMWGWWKECVAYSTSGGGGGDVRIEQSGSWELSIEAKCFISSVSCLISRRRAAFCLSKSSLS